MSACLCKRKFKFGFFVKQNAALLSTFRASVDNKHWQSSSIFLCLMSDLEYIPSLSILDSRSDCGLHHSRISFELMTFILPETPANSLQHHFLSPGKCTKSKYPFPVVLQLVRVKKIYNSNLLYPIRALSASDENSLCLCIAKVAGDGRLSTCSKMPSVS